MAVRRILEPASRISEVMFGLIMALTFTGSLSIADAGRNDVRAMLIGALGCNIAWGVIDGIFNVMLGFADRRTHAIAMDAMRKAADPAQARALLAGTLPEDVAAVMGDAQLDALRERLAHTVAPVGPPRLGMEDFLTGLAVAVLVFASTFPIALPFVVFQDANTAMRVSNGIAMAMLFVSGALYARIVGGRGWLLGVVMVVFGSVLVAMTIALGG